MTYARGKKRFTDAEVREALAIAGSRRKAAKYLNTDRRSLSKRIDRMEENGNLPIVPEGHKIKGVSTLQRITDESGETVLQWIKTAEDADKREKACQEALDARKEKLPSIHVRVRPPKLVTEDDLLSCYIVTDYHLGMLSWKPETGDDWDLKIARDMLIDWFRYTIENGPASSVGLLAQLGDFLHYDSLQAVTAQSGHVLDSDTRPQKMIRAGMHVLRQAIDMMLQKHDTVHVLMAEGNHDPMGSAWLREAFAIIYESEPRVTVETRPDPYYAFPWGNTALFFHHGHLRKPNNIDHVFVRKFRGIYGKAKHAYAHLGHLHHERVIESNLMKIEQHPTLAGADAYASRGGWLSDREASVIHYHRQHGQVGRLCVSPGILNKL